MIDIQRLTFAYPNSVFKLSVQSLAIASGEKLAVVGASGTGKTTLLNLMAGILVPSSGSLQVLGESLGEMTDAQRRNFRIANIGMVFQQFELIDYLTVIDNVRLPFLINRTLSQNQSSIPQAENLLESVGLTNFAQRYPHQLSRGEQQRVAICRALITQPSILLADEPTGNLDPDNKHKILELLFSHTRQHNQTLILVTHDHSILSEFDRVIDFATFLTASHPVASEATT